MKPATQHHVEVHGRRIDYRVVLSRAAHKLRLRVGLNGVEVIRPAERTSQEASAFLYSNASWVLAQIRRIERVRSVRRLERAKGGDLFFRGKPTQVRINATRTRARGNVVTYMNDEIVVHRGASSQTPVVRSLENWLRKQARIEIAKQLAAVTSRLRHKPGRIYVMGQRTKWGNCSSKGNLSFNWRLILAPDFVLRYMVIHEAAHLAVLDHSAKFWFTVRSLCPETGKAKQWLRTNENRLLEPLSEVARG